MSKPNVNFVFSVIVVVAASAGYSHTRPREGLGAVPPSPWTEKYINTTQNAISAMLKIEKVKVIINISPAVPPIKMKTSILARSSHIKKEQLTLINIQEIQELTRNYVPGYFPSIDLKSLGEKTICQVTVTGSGHYLPAYAGNLDIINCAAIEVMEKL